MLERATEEVGVRRVGRTPARRCRGQRPDVVLAQHHERDATRAEQVLVPVDEDIVEPVDHVVERHEWHAMRGIEEHLRTDGIRSLDDLAHR